MSMIGKTLGSFECTALIGKGGMGEVYRAKDQKLGRDVAIKVLPEEFAKDADRVARFQREAKLLASLNHPNIAAIHGLEESDGTHFLVLELIEGDTLADRLKRGAIPVEEALKLALQIAEALEAAHEKGVIHRDLKPANIKVTPEGKVKVLDFGLAKAFAENQEDMNLSNSPTLSVAATQQGIILGTAAYMSPEQASGEVTDKRTDIWAFGVVLFEMLTGRSLFEGNNVTQTLASVIKSEPEWQTLPPNLHPRIRLLLERCLEKDPKKRYSGVNDAWVDIDKALTDPAGVFAQPIATTGRSKARLPQMLSWASITIILIVIAGIIVWNAKTPEPPQIIYVDYDLPADQEFTALQSQLVAISADGTKIAYVANRQIYLKDISKLIANPIQGTAEDPSVPFFSPDGQWVGYFSSTDMQLKKISIEGGAPKPLCDTGIVLGADWSSNDKIIFSNINNGIVQISANGGSPQKLIAAEGNNFFYHPKLLPDGKHVIFTSGLEKGYKVFVQSLESMERKELIEGDCAWYLTSGYIVYALGNNLYSARFDFDSLQMVGAAALMIEGVFRLDDSLTFVPQWALSNAGTLVYVPETTTPATTSRTLVYVDREGKEEPLSFRPDFYHDPRVSHDGMRIALTISRKSNQDIWIGDLETGILTPLTSDEAINNTPLWSPDDRWIDFASVRTENMSVYRKASDGTAEVKLLASMSNYGILPWSWSADGNSLLMQAITLSPIKVDIGIFTMEGDQSTKLLFKEKYHEKCPKISPDGRLMAYTSNESGQNEVWIRPFPNVNRGRWMVSKGGGISPLWSPDGKELFYRSNESVMAVTVKMDPNFNHGTPTELFRGKYYSFNLLEVEFDQWDMSSDGKRFLMIKNEAPTTSSAGNPRKINIVVNWLEELKERVPAD